jgi:hypothetical protein
MLGKAFSKAKELTSKGLSKSKEYAKDKVHEQKRKIAVDVINSTDNKVKTKQEHLHLDRARQIVATKFNDGGGVGKKVKLTGFKVEGSLFATSKNKIPFDVVINGVKASGKFGPKFTYTHQGVDVNELLVNGKKIEITSSGGTSRSYELDLGGFKEKEKQPKNLQFTGPYYELSDLGTKFKTKLLDIINNKPELLTEDFKKVFNITTNTEKQYSNGSKLMMEGGITNGDVSNSKFIYTIGGL